LRQNAGITHVKPISYDESIVRIRPRYYGSWCVRSVDFDAAQRQLNIAVDFVAGSRFGYVGVGPFTLNGNSLRRNRPDTMFIAATGFWLIFHGLRLGKIAF
jgi:hypothetical protein